MYKHRHKNRRKNKQRKIIVGSVFTLLLCISIGYAAFQTTLKVNVKGNIIKTKDSCFTVSDNGDGTGTITDYDKTCGTKVKIPSKINNLIITKIGDVESTTSIKLFARKGITSLVFPDTLIYIGDNCCIGLGATNIIIPSKVKIIGGHAFAWGSIQSITLPEGLETIVGGAFESNSLKHLKIPSTVKNLQNTIASSNYLEGDEAFIYARDENGKEDKTKLITFGDRNRTNVIVPDGVKIIGTASFVNDNGIETVTLPNSVTTIKTQAFWSMSKLKQVNIGNGIQSIESIAFYVTPNLTTININKISGSITGSPWGATNAAINYTGSN